MIKTSVIIPVYNTGLYLNECINSVFSQTQKEIEVIAINDGSTDDSLEVLLRLQKIYPKLIIMTQENHGLGYTRNIGVERARGQYIYFLDSDDYILEDTLERCYELASRNKLDVVLFDALEFEDSIERRPLEPNPSDRHEIIEEREEIFTGRYFLEKYYQKAYHPAACLVYCSAFFIKRNSIRFLPKVYFEDNEFYCRIMTLAERVMYIPKMYYQYRCRTKSITGSEFNVRKARDHIEVINAMADLKTLNGGEGWYIIKKICLNLLHYIADMCGKNALYAEDNSLPDRTICAWEKVCGDRIEITESLEDIEYIYRICSLFPDLVLSEKKEMIDARRRILLIQEFWKLPLHQKKSHIAIYGCGQYTDRVLNLYEKWIGAIKADIIFLDSYIKEEGTRFRGYSVYPVSEVQDKELDCILISSPLYEEEMYDMIKELYGGKFVTVMLHGDMHINV